MGLTKIAQEYLDKCRVIGFSEVKEGIIVSSNLCDEFEVSSITIRNGEVKEEFIDEFDLFDFFDKNRSKMIVNFKKTMSDIVGRKRYYLEESVYNFLSDKDPDYDYYENEDYDDAKERAMREAAEEETAEHEFERFLKLQEEL